MRRNFISSERAAQCSRSWEIEAARDGRLSGEARDALGRHVARCPECRRRSEYVEGLGQALRALEPEIDEVAVRRLRQEVLAEVDAELAGRSIRPRPPKRRRYVTALALTACLPFVVLPLILWRRAPTPVASTPKAVPATLIDARDEGGARWSQETEGDTEYVELSEGTLRLKVERKPGGKRVVVRAPDGEIEDLGTVFRVVVNQGRTQRVGVEEGRVTIRLANKAPITISAGQTWERPDDSQVPASSMVVTSSRSPAVPPIRPPVVATASPPPSLSAPVPPSNAAQEDEAYLHVIRLLRDGRQEDAKRAAREYLRRFPDGFRREEMGRIAGTP